MEEAERSGEGCGTSEGLGGCGGLTWGLELVTEGCSCSEEAEDTVG